MDVLTGVKDVMSDEEGKLSRDEETSAESRGGTFQCGQVIIQ